MAINWVNVRARGRPSSNSNPNVWLRVSKIKAGRGRHALNIIIYDALMKAAGFNAGDRVRIGFDETFVYLEKNPQHGWLLSPAMNKDKRKAAMGKRVTSVLKAPDIAQVPEGLFTKEDLVIDDDGTISFMRSQLLSFD